MRAIAKNTIFLFLAQFGGYLIPLLELPLLSRVLGPAEYGSILYAQAIAFTAAIVVEYGFNFSAARTVAVEGHDPLVVRRLLANVMGAKLILALALLFIFSLLGVAGLINPQILPLSYWVWVLVFFMAFGFSPFWYFQGRERLKGVVALDFSLRGSALALMFLLVKAPADAVFALSLQAMAGILSTSIQSYWVVKAVGWQQPSLSGGVKQLCEGWHAFLYRGGSNVLAAMNAAMLGGLSTTAQLGLFAPVEKVVRAGVGLSVPLTMAVSPHVSRGFAVRARETMSTVGKIIGLSVTLACLASFIVFLSAHWLVELAFGSSYVAAVDVLLVFIWVFPIRVACQFLALLWLLPNHKEHYASVAMLLASVLAVMAAMWAIPRYGALGLAWVAVLAESVQLTMLLLAVIKDWRALKPINQSVNHSVSERL